MGQRRSGMTKYTMFVRSGIMLMEAAVLSLGLGCKQPSAPPDAGEEETPQGTAAITLSLANESGSLTITPAGPVSIGKTGSPGSVTFMVSGTGFNGFTWIVDGLPLPGAAPSITLRGTDYRPGGHSVTVYAMKDAVYWSPEAAIQFTVIP
jgi:hypothetical protein